MKRFWKNQFTSYFANNITKLFCPVCNGMDSLLSYVDTPIRTCSNCNNDFLLSKEYIYLLEETKGE